RAEVVRGIQIWCPKIVEIPMVEVPVVVPVEEVEEVPVVVLEAVREEPDIVRCNFCGDPYIKGGLYHLRPETEEAVLVKPVSLPDKLSLARSVAEPLVLLEEFLEGVFSGAKWI